MGLRALHYFLSWSEDDSMIPYVKNAHESYDLLEQSLVNQNLPKQY